VCRKRCPRSLTDVSRPAVNAAESLAHALSRTHKGVVTMPSVPMESDASVKLISASRRHVAAIQKAESGSVLETVLVTASLNSSAQPMTQCAGGSVRVGRCRSSQTGVDLRGVTVVKILSALPMTRSVAVSVKAVRCLLFQTDAVLPAASVAKIPSVLPMTRSVAVSVKAARCRRSPMDVVHLAVNAMSTRSVRPTTRCANASVWMGLCLSYQRAVVHPDAYVTGRSVHRMTRCVIASARVARCPCYRLTVVRRAVIAGMHRSTIALSLAVNAERRAPSVPMVRMGFALPVALWSRPAVYPTPWSVRPMTRCVADSVRGARCQSSPMAVRLRGVCAKDLNVLRTTRCVDGSARAERCPRFPMSADHRAVTVAKIRSVLQMTPCADGSARAVSFPVCQRAAVHRAVTAT
jgi:hypothetical protein